MKTILVFILTAYSSIVFSQLKIIPSIEMHNQKLCLKVILDNQYNDSIWISSSREGNIRGTSGFFLKCFNKMNQQLGISFPLNFASRSLLFIQPKKQQINYYPVNYIEKYVGANINDIAELELEIYSSYKITKNYSIISMGNNDFTIRLPFPQKTMELMDENKYYPYLRGFRTNLQTVQNIMEQYKYPVGNLNKVYQAFKEKDGIYKRRYGEKVLKRACSL